MMCENYHWQLPKPVTFELLLVPCSGTMQIDSGLAEIDTLCSYGSKMQKRNVPLW